MFMLQRYREGTIALLAAMTVWVSNQQIAAASEARMIDEDSGIVLEQGMNGGTVVEEKLPFGFEQLADLKLFNSEPLFVGSVLEIACQHEETTKRIGLSGPFSAKVVHHRSKKLRQHKSNVVASR